MFYLGSAGLVEPPTYAFLGGAGNTSSSSASTKPKQATSALDPEGFLDLNLKTVESYGHNNSRFVFEMPGDGSGAALSPFTSLVVVRASEGVPGASEDKKGKLAVRAYTPISRPEHEGEIVLLIKKYEKGVISKYVHERRQGPHPQVPLQRYVGFPHLFRFSCFLFPFHTVNEHEDEGVVPIGGGSGITPFYQHLDSALRVPANKTYFTRLYANVSK